MPTVATKLSEQIADVVASQKPYISTGSPKNTRYIPEQWDDWRRRAETVLDALEELGYEVVPTMNEED